MKTFPKAMAAMAFAAALSFTSQAIAAPACRLFQHSHFGGSYFDIPANTKVDNFLAIIFWVTKQECDPEWPAPQDEGASEISREERVSRAQACRTVRSSAGNADNEISSVQVPDGCGLVLHEHPNFAGGRAGYKEGNYPEAFAGTPNDTASSAECTCALDPFFSYDSIIIAPRP